MNRCWGNFSSALLTRINFVGETRGDDASVLAAWVGFFWANFRRKTSENVQVSGQVKRNDWIVGIFVSQLEREEKELLYSQVSQIFILF